MLLPPKVVDPISEVSTSVTVLGAENGATVQLLGNGLPVGMPAVASGLSVNVSVIGSTLTAGMQITAIVSHNGETSAPWPFPIVVSAAPTPVKGLPSIVFLSGAHPCIDWILIGGLYPGATVEVQHKGKHVGGLVASGCAVSVPITFSSSPAPGDTLEAFQTFTTSQGVVIKGPTVSSLPMQKRPAGEPPVPTVQPPYECDLAVLVSGLMDGASLVVKQDLQELAGYPFVGTPIWAELQTPVKLVEQFTARQRFVQCRTDSPFSPSVGAINTPKLPTPVIVEPVCPNAALLRVRNLRPGARVLINVEVASASSTSASLIGIGRAWATDCEFPLPPNWAADIQKVASPGQLRLKVSQECSDKSSDSAIILVQPLPGVVGRPGMQTPMECARLIAATSLTPGAYVIVISDQSDWPQLSGPIFVSASNMPLGVNRPLRAHERVIVRQVGCNAGIDSASIEVVAFPGVNPPLVVSPVRIPHGGINLRSLVIGARVHLYLNGVPKVSFDAQMTEMFVPVAGLAQEMQVWARQSMCTKISGEGNHEPATLGQMKVGHTPNPIIRTISTAITVTAKDADNGQAVHGSVRIGATTVGVTAVPFAFTFPMGAAPVSVVDATDYVNGQIGWNLQDPAPAQQAMLHLSLTNQAPSYYKIASVVWSIERQELNGSFTLVASPTGESIAVHPPSAGQYHVYAAVSVQDKVYGGTILAEFRGNVIVNGLGTLMISWNNLAQSHTFKLTAETQTVFGGGAGYMIVNPVVLTVS